MNTTFLLQAYIAIGAALGVVVMCTGLYGVLRNLNKAGYGHEQNGIMHILKWSLAAVATVPAWPVVAWWVVEGEINRRRHSHPHKSDR